MTSKEYDYKYYNIYIYIIYDGIFGDAGPVRAVFGYILRLAFGTFF